jgi:hypothetical protein
LADDRKGLAEDYRLTARYFLKSTKTNLDVVADLRACRVSVALDIPIPENKGSRAIGTWLAKSLNGSNQTGISLVFDWPGTKDDQEKSIDQFLADPGAISDARKDAPRSIRVLSSIHGVRRFKSRKKFIEDVEDITNNMVDLGMGSGWIC